MKKFKLLAIAILIGIASTFARENNPDPVTPLPTLRAQIAEMLPKQLFGIESDEIVNIHFTYNTAGEIVVLKVESKNRSVINYIKKYLNHKKVDLPGEVGKLYHLPLKIKAV